MISLDFRIIGFVTTGVLQPANKLTANWRRKHSVIHEKCVGTKI